MELSSKNIFARYYKFIHCALPSDVCSFFWGTVLIILLSPVVVVGRLVWFADHDGLKNELGNGVKVYIGYLIVWLIGVFGLTQNMEIKTLTDFIDLFTITQIIFLPFLTGIALSLLMAVCLAFVLFCAWLGELIERYIKKKRREKRNDYDPIFEKGPSRLSIWWGAIRNKYCTKIEWK